MIRLFEENATVFTGLGLGVLHDAISCKVTDQQNGEYELEMTYPITGTLYKELKEKLLIVTKVNLIKGYDEQAFRIYMISEPINGEVTINARHISYDLSNYIVQPFEAKDPQEVMDKITNGIRYLSHDTRSKWYFRTTYEHPEVTDTTTDDEEKKETKMTVKTPSSLRQILGGDGGLLDTFGGSLEFNNFNVIHHCKEKPRGEDRGFEIRYGSNMTELDVKKEIKNDFTAIYPYHAKTESETDSDENTKYKPVYIAPKITEDLKFTRKWLSLEKDGQAMDPEKELVNTGRPISQALQIKTPGEYKDKLFVYISDKLLNIQNGVSNLGISAASQLAGTITEIKSLFEFKEHPLTSGTYVSGLYYYEIDPINKPEVYTLDTSETFTEGRVYKDAFLKGTNWQAGHYYQVPKPAYISNASGDLKAPQSGSEIDIDNNVNNTNLWLAYEHGGEPISRYCVNPLMRAIPMVVQEGIASGHIVMYDSTKNNGSGGYRELKTGVEKEYTVTETNEDSKTIIFDLKIYNEVTMDADKIKDGKVYFFSNVSYEEVNLTPETYEANKYYYKGDPVYSPAMLTITHGDPNYNYEPGVYYYKKVKTDTTEPDEYVRDDSSVAIPGRIYYDKIDQYVLDTNEEYTETTTYYKQKIMCTSVFYPIQFTEEKPYEPDKYFYVDNNKSGDVPYLKWHFVLDNRPEVTPGIQYYEIRIMKETSLPLHQVKFDKRKTDYYKVSSCVITNEPYYNTEYELAQTFEPDTTYYEIVNDFVSAMAYYNSCPDAPLIYIDEKNKDDSKVLAVDLSSYIEGEPTGELLIEAANKYIEENQKKLNQTDESISTDFVRLSDTLGYEFIGNLEEIQNGDLIKVVKNDSDLRIKLRVISMEFNVLENTYSGIELGTKDEDLTDTVLTNGADISSLVNDSGFVDRAEVKHLIVDTLDAENINVTGFFEASRSYISNLVSDLIQVTDLRAEQIVSGVIESDDVIIKSKIDVRGYRRIDEIVDKASYIAYNNYNGVIWYFDDYKQVKFSEERPYQSYKYYYLNKTDEGLVYVLDTEETATEGRVYYEHINSDELIVDSGYPRNPDRYVKDRVYYSNNDSLFTVMNDGTIEATGGRIGNCTILPVPQDRLVIRAEYQTEEKPFTENWLYVWKYREVTFTEENPYVPNKFYYWNIDKGTYTLDSSEQAVEGQTYYEQYKDVIVPDNAHYYNVKYDELDRYYEFKIDFVYTEIALNSQTYKPNTYYYINENDEYVLDESDNYTADRIYYTQTERRYYSDMNIGILQVPGASVTGLLDAVVIRSSTIQIGGNLYDGFKFMVDENGELWASAIHITNGKAVGMESVLSLKQVSQESQTEKLEVSDFANIGSSLSIGDVELKQYEWDEYETNIKQIKMHVHSQWSDRDANNKHSYVKIKIYIEDHSEMDYGMITFDVDEWSVHFAGKTINVPETHKSVTVPYTISNRTNPNVIPRKVTIDAKKGYVEYEMEVDGWIRGATYTFDEIVLTPQTYEPNVYYTKTDEGVYVLCRDDIFNSEYTYYEGTPNYDGTPTSFEIVKHYDLARLKDDSDYEPNKYYYVSPTEPYLYNEISLTFETYESNKYYVCQQDGETIKYLLCEEATFEPDTTYYERSNNYIGPDKSSVYVYTEIALTQETFVPNKYYTRSATQPYTYRLAATYSQFRTYYERRVYYEKRDVQFDVKSKLAYTINYKNVKAEVLIDEYIPEANLTWYHLRFYIENYVPDDFDFIKFSYATRIRFPKVWDFKGSQTYTEKISEEYIPPQWEEYIYEIDCSTGVLDTPGHLIEGYIPLEPDSSAEPVVFNSIISPGDPFPIKTYDPTKYKIALQVNNGIKTEDAYIDNLHISNLHYYHGDEKVAIYKHTIYIDTYVKEGTSHRINYNAIYDSTGIHFDAQLKDGTYRWQHIINISVTIKKTYGNDPDELTEIRFFTSGDRTAEWDGTNLDTHIHEYGAVRADVRSNGIEVHFPKIYDMGTIEYADIVLDIIYE